MVSHVADVAEVQILQNNTRRTTITHNWIHTRVLELAWSEDTIASMVASGDISGPDIRRRRNTPSRYLIGDRVWEALLSHVRGKGFSGGPSCHMIAYSVDPWNGRRIVDKQAFSGSQGTWCEEGDGETYLRN